jgi:lysophospholipase L1-like esterase
MQTSKCALWASMLKSTGRLSAALIAAGALAMAGFAADIEGNGNNHWVGTWGTALHEPDLGVPGLSNTGFNNQTLRQIVHISVGGHRVRVRLSTFGAKSLVIGAAHIAIQDSGATIVAGSDRTLTFGGNPTITIPPGAPALSDPVDLNVPEVGNLAISIFVPETTGPATWHFESRQTSYVSPAGDFTGSTMMPVSSTPLAWFWLAGVEISAPRQTGVIVVVGDSITDGSQSTPDANSRWTDQLARRFMAERGNHGMAVLNQGLAGGRVLHNSLGPSALARFDAAVLAQAGVTHVIVQGGGNDIFALDPAENVSADQVIQGLRQMIERAHEQGLKVFGCTLNPIEGFLQPGTPIPLFSPAGEAKRQTINAWIRTTGEYDGVFDFDQMLRDPNSPTRMLSTLDSGDHGHPTDAGYRALADAINLHLFKNEDGR